MLGGKKGRKTRGKGWRNVLPLLALAACDDHEDRSAASVREK